jgi:hypothetical protein
MDLGIELLKCVLKPPEKKCHTEHGNPWDRKIGQ